MTKNIAEWNGIAVFIEQDEGKIADISLELLGKGRELADKSNNQLIAFVMGKDIKTLGDELIARGADHVVLADHNLLEHYKWETYSKIGEAMIKKYKPSSLIMGATPDGRDLAGRLAVRLSTGLTADVIELDINEEDLLLGSVPGFGGSVVAIIKCEHARPQMATVRPGIFSIKEMDTSRKGKVETFSVELDQSHVSTELIRKIKIDMEDISKAKRLVAAGRGAASNLTKVQELGQLLEAKVGVTRPLCDAGLLPRNYQIGSTGVTVKPEFTLVLGASGAMHFTSGINDSDRIIAVNSDETAPIFDQSDYIVVADVDKLLPLIVDKMKQRLQKAKEVRS